MEHCQALTKWSIVKAIYPTNADKTLTTLTEAIQFDLKRVVGVKYLDNFIIRIIRTNNKPVLVLIKDYIARHNNLDLHLNGPYLCHNLALKTFHKKAEKIFGHHKKQYQARYAETNEEVKTDETPLKTLFGGCHTADVASVE